MKQNEMILEHLKKHVGITPNEAKELYSVSRLSARIYDLKQKGYTITMLWRTEPNKFGKKCRFAEYRLCQK